MAKEVSYMCKRTVVSTKPVQPEKYYPLSVFDRVMEHNRLQVVYYYRSTRAREAPGELIVLLRESFAAMLTCFPIVTGRLQRDDQGNWMIKCNDAGVRVVEARVKGSVEEWLQTVNREKELDQLVHWEEMFHKPYFWSTFYAQVTEFEGGGLAVGLSCIHLLADPTCATMFIKAWADMTLAGKMIAPPLFHPLPPRRLGNKDINHKPYSHLINHYKSSTMLTSKPSTEVKHATVTLTFTDNMVRACMDMGRSTSSNSIPSPFEALAGLLWVCITKVKGITQGLINMSICLDMRKVLGLDKCFFGNCMVYNKVDGEIALISDAAKAIGEVVGKMDTEGIVDLIEWLQCNDNQYSPPLNNFNLICASLEDLDPYLAMFEDGFKPIHVSYYVEPVFGRGQVLILPSPPGEGPLSRVVMVTLPEEEVVKLCENALIISFSPTVAMGVNKSSE